MNREELIRKIAFVKGLSPAISFGMQNIKSVEYVVFLAEENKDWYTEFVVVHYLGGAVQARDCTGNSCSAIFNEIGTMLNTSQKYPENTEMYLNMLEKQKPMEL